MSKQPDYVVVQTEPFKYKVIPAEEASQSSYQILTKATSKCMAEQLMGMYEVLYWWRPDAPER